MKRIWKCIYFAAICLLLVSGCGRHVNVAETGTVPEAKSWQIGLSFDSFVIERWLRDRDVFVSTAEELGASVNVQNANGDVDEQISQIQYFIKKKMDVIVIVAIDADALSDVVSQAKDAGIRVICYDRLIKNADTDLYISFDNERVGELMGQALAQALPDGGSIFAIHGSRADNNVALVSEGLKKALDGTGISIVYSNYCDNWLAELAFDAVNEGLEQTGSVDGIMCGNDDLASQAIRALSEHRLAGRVPVVAQDAELAACQRIVEGTQTMTVYKHVDDEARIAAILAVELASGKDITGADEEYPVTETIHDGSYDIPCYLIEPVPVTKENLDEVIIDSGFHRREEVYLNVQ
ncbi:MAG: substrate-binding domain-containing protein [Lachnospiraceae bacterium]|nr:substrate-binding domain-containing protein [Lachnospiraceae bacterium]